MYVMCLPLACGWNDLHLGLTFAGGDTSVNLILEQSEQSAFIGGNGFVDLIPKALGPHLFSVENQDTFTFLSPPSLSLIL